MVWRTHRYEVQVPNPPKTAKEKKEINVRGSRVNEAGASKATAQAGRTGAVGRL